MSLENPDYREARQFLRDRRWPEAAIVLRSLHRHDPSSVGVSLDLSRALAFSGRREEALSLLEQLLSREKKASRREFLMRRVRVLSRMFYSNDSFQAYQDGVNLLSAGKYRPARERLEKALALEPDNVEVLVRIGQSLVLEQDEDSAAERLKFARKLNAFEPEVRLWLGRAMHRRGELREAVEELRIAQQELGNSQLAPVWYAEALSASGQRGAAAEVLEKDSQANPFHLESLLASAKQRLSGAPREAQLWAARKELQLAASRLPQYLASGRGRFEGELGLELARDAEELKEEIHQLQKQVDGRIEKRGD